VKNSKANLKKVMHDQHQISRYLMKSFESSLSQLGRPDFQAALNSNHLIQSLC